LLAAYNINLKSTLDLEEKMWIYVKETLCRLIYSVNVDNSYNIDNIKNKIEATEGFPKSRQRLIFGDEQLEGKRTLVDYKICEDCTLFLVLLSCNGDLCEDARTKDHHF
jgi:ubiquitin C